MRDPSIQERVTASDYERVSRESEADAKGLQLAKAALDVLTGGLSERCRGEIFGGIRRRLDGEQEVESLTDLELLHELLKAKDVVAERQEQATGVADDARESARWVEENGLPR